MAALYFGFALTLGFVSTLLVAESLLWVIISLSSAARSSRSQISAISSGTREQIDQLQSSTQDQISTFEATSHSHIDEVRKSTQQEIVALREEFSRVVSTLKENIDTLTEVNKNIERVSADMREVADDVREERKARPDLNVEFGDADAEAKKVEFRFEGEELSPTCAVIPLGPGKERAVKIKVFNRGTNVATSPIVSLSVPSTLEVLSGGAGKVTRNPDGTAILLRGDPLMGGERFSINHEFKVRASKGLHPGTIIPIHYLTQCEGVSQESGFMAVEIT